MHSGLSEMHFSYEGIPFIYKFDFGSWLQAGKFLGSKHNCVLIKLSRVLSIALEVSTESLWIFHHCGLSGYLEL